MNRNRKTRQPMVQPHKFLRPTKPKGRVERRTSRGNCAGMILRSKEAKK